MKKTDDFILAAFLAVCVATSLLIPLPARAQAFPSKPLTIYCGFEAGATTDVTARALAQEAQKLLGVPVVVENKAGGGATVAASLLATKKPDGYTLGVITSSALDTSHILLKVPFNPFKDFTRILSYGTYPGGICVNSTSPYKAIQDLLEAARQKPGTLSFSVPGPGAPQRLAVDYLAKQAKVQFKCVPYKGGAPACTAVIGGHVDFTAGAGLHLNYVRQGIFRMLALICAEERDPDHPQVPTLKDLGYEDVPAARYLLVAPQGLPEPVFKKLADIFTQAVYSSEFQKTLKNLETPFAFRNHQQLEEAFPRTYKFYADFLNERGLMPK